MKTHESIKERVARDLANAMKNKELKTVKKDEIDSSIPFEDNTLKQLKSIGVNPKEDSNKAENAIGEINTSSDLNLFPVEVFPNTLQEVINATNKDLNYPIDFIGSAILAASSAAIGNTCKVVVKKGWIESALIYIVIIGRPGTGKSHPLKFAFRPIQKRDTDSFKKFKEEKARIEAMEKEERKKYESENEKPVWNRILVTDFTIEALTSVMNNNYRGVAVFVDELAGWIKSFNRYTKGKGNEQEFWLTVWSGGTIRVDRKNSDPILIEYPFVPVCGTIQPSILEKIGKIDLSENGFIDRILFTISSNNKKHYLNDNQIPESIEENWNNIVSKMLDIPLMIDEGELKPKLLIFSVDGYKAWARWNKLNTDRCNSEESDILTNVFSKLDMYVVRLSLILQILYWACKNESDYEISLEAVQGAIKLVEYFRINAIKANAIISNLVESLPTGKRKIYEALTDEFTTADGLIVAREFGMPEKTFKNFLNDKNLFEKIRHGFYSKKY